eukprot:gene40978-50701_t
MQQIQKRGWSQQNQQVMNDLADEIAVRNEIQLDDASDSDDDDMWSGHDGDAEVLQSELINELASVDSEEDDEFNLFVPIALNCLQTETPPVSLFACLCDHVGCQSSVDSVSDEMDSTDEDVYIQVIRHADELHQDGLCERQDVDCSLTPSQSGEWSCLSRFVEEAIQRDTSDPTERRLLRQAFCASINAINVDCAEPVNVNMSVISSDSDVRHTQDLREYNQMPAVSQVPVWFEAYQQRYEQDIRDGMSASDRAPLSEAFDQVERWTSVEDGQSAFVGSADQFERVVVKPQLSSRSSARDWSVGDKAPAVPGNHHGEGPGDGGACSLSSRKTHNSGASVLSKVVPQFSTKSLQDALLVAEIGAVARMEIEVELSKRSLCNRHPRLQSRSTDSILLVEKYHSRLLDHDWSRRDCCQVSAMEWELERRHMRRERLEVDNAVQLLKEANRRDEAIDLE